MILVEEIEMENYWGLIIAGILINGIIFAAFCNQIRRKITLDVINAKR